MTTQPQSSDVLATALSDDDIRALSANIARCDLCVVAIKLDGSDRIAAAFGRSSAMTVRQAALDAVAELVAERARVFIGGAANGGVIFDVTRTDSALLISDIAARLSSTIEVDGVDYCIENNIGVAVADDGVSDDPVDLLQAAIGAVHASQLAQTHIAYAADVSLADLRAEVLLAAELANSVGEAFTLHYQPIVTLDTQAVVGYESLLRWTVNGHIRLPGEFLDAAEETSLIVPIGRWGAAEAIRQLAVWRQSDPDLFMSVNFSSQQLFDRELAAHVGKRLDADGVPASALWVEITERDLIAPDSPAAQTIRDLDALGCVVCVDDLGTGYAALRYLVDQPVKVAKIDRSLVSGIDDDDTKRRIVEAVCRLSENMDIATVAEGVESEDQLARLRQVGFTHAQGFLFGRPRAAHDVDR